MMLILENLRGLKSKQADVTTAFLHATLGKDEKVYVEMPLGFNQNGSNEKIKVLCLKKTQVGDYILDTMPIELPLKTFL